MYSQQKKQIFCKQLIAQSRQVSVLHRVIYIFLYISLEPFKRKINTIMQMQSPKSHGKQIIPNNEKYYSYISILFSTYIYAYTHTHIDFQLQQQKILQVKLTQLNNFLLYTNQNIFIIYFNELLYCILFQSEWKSRF